MEIRESDGVRAIIFLQKFAGIDEPYEKARHGWRMMTQAQRENTILAFRILSKEKEKK